MIVTSLNRYYEYRFAEKGFETAWEFIRKMTIPDLLALPEGRVEIDGDDVFALRQSYLPICIDNTSFEMHAKYADIQIILKGQEGMAYLPDICAYILEEKAPFDAQKDITKFIPPDQVDLIRFHKGMFAIFFPGELHMPKIRITEAEEKVEKLVIKVKIDD